MTAKKLSEQLKTDPELRQAWVANIAMAYKDNYAWYRKEVGRQVMNREDLHIIANRAAEYFIDQFCK